MYYSLVHSHISYGVPVHGIMYTTILNTPQIAKNSIIRIIMLFAKKDVVRHLRIRRSMFSRPRASLTYSYANKQATKKNHVPFKC